MRITRKFKQLTRFTYPHGTELGLLRYLPKGYQEDGLGNYYLKIGESTTMFTCHLDTACSYQSRVTHVESGDFIETDGTTILGADDKAGMVVMLYMIEKQVPGLYYFFIGEEVGCIGSGRLSKAWSDYDFSNYITKVVSFDRRGTDSVITDQLFGTCCSNEFAEELAFRLNSVNKTFYFSPDPTGIYTDSAKFMDLVPECTNISVGYYNEHSCNETQDLDFLRKLCRAVCDIDWETLPVVRDPKDASNWDDWDDEDEDDQTWDESNFSYFQGNGDSVEKLFISDTQISDEKYLIRSWLKSSKMYPGFKSIIWNGNTLYVETHMIELVGDRIELIEFLPDLGSVPMNCLRKDIEVFID